MEFIGENIPECMKCPICFELPDGDVFQCRNGHILCGSCSTHRNLKKRCPQCRVPFGRDKIRNRVLEEILDQLRVDCPYKDCGCTEVICRKSVRDHVKMCVFGCPIDICELLGLGKCSFCLQAASPTEIIEHLKTDHGVTTTNLGNKNAFFIKHSEFLKNFQQMKDEGQRFKLFPLLMTMTLDGKQYTLLRLLVVDCVDETLAYIPFYFPEDEIDESSENQFKYTVKFKLTTESSYNADWKGKVLPLEWDTSPLSIYKASELLPDFYSCRVPIIPLIEDISEREQNLFCYGVVEKLEEVKESKRRKIQSKSEEPLYLLPTD